MKKFGFLIILLVGFAVQSQAQKSPRKSATNTIDGLTIEVDYGAPSVRGRKIWGGLESFGKVWRAGANENTTISFSKDVQVGGENLPAGKYGFFIIPNEEGDWVVIFNKTNDAWGAYSYKESDDALRLNLTPETTDTNQELLTYTVNENSIGFAWERKTLSIPFSSK